jgi:aromatic-L-amino-acid decarboxylase
MKKKILHLEKLSRQLEPSADERKIARKKVINYGENFLRTIERGKAHNVTRDEGKALLHSPIRETPESFHKVIGLLRDNVDFPGLNPASPGHLGYIPGGGLYYSALGDYLAAVFNRYAGAFSVGPGAVRMENMLIRWMAKVVGFPDKAVGNLTTGGSLANLMGVVTARDAMKVSSANVKRTVIYLSQQAHHSIDKAIRIAGLNECIKRYIPLDTGYRLSAPALERQIEEDKRRKLNPFLVVATAGTTDVGAIDPLEDIGVICRKNKLWYHVDAAYGGFFVLTKEGKQKLRGIERADSLVIDPHKGLFLPYGLGVILVKDKQALNASHFYQANYMQDTKTVSDEPSPSDLSPELTKHFRGLRLWLPLKLHGVKPFRACLEEKLLLAKYFYQEIAKLGFEVGVLPELSVVTYRYVPAKIADDLKKVNEFNKDLLDLVLDDGHIFISSTLLEGRYMLRFACLSFRTHLHTVDKFLKILRLKTHALQEARGYL